MSDNFEASIRYVLEKVNSEDNQQFLRKSMCEEAAKANSWGYVNGIDYGIRALVAAGVLETNFNGRKIFAKKDKNEQNQQQQSEEKSFESATDAEKVIHLTEMLETWRNKHQAALSEVENKVNRIAQVEHSLKVACDLLEKEKKTKSILEIKILDKDGNETKSHIDTYHQVFEKVLTLARKRKNIFIYGPTGSGKSHLSEQVAKVLGLPFKFISCTQGMSEAKLEGRLLPIGDSGKFEYVVSEFIQAYETGGVFLLDEMDACDPNVLLIVNSALANGRIALGNRPEKPYAIKHPDFILIAAANTIGTGADRMYSGRNKLDASTMDRFAIGKVYMDYDPVVEKVLCPDDELRNRLQRYRRGIREHSLERAISTRFLRDSYELTHPTEHEQAQGIKPWTIKEVEDALFQGWREDEINKAKSAN